jgi:hypothetical protein
LAMGVVGPLVTYWVGEQYLEAAQSSWDAVGTRVPVALFSNPWWLVGQVGLFGYGVGTKTQGSQHLEIEIDTPPFEGGFEKVMVELGVVGIVAVLVFLLVLGRCMVLCFRRIREARIGQLGPAAVAAFLGANAATFTLSFQIYGDPLVVFLVGFAGGLLLSGIRLADRCAAPMPAEWPGPLPVHELALDGGPKL